MGMSTDGILFFGYLFEKDAEKAWGDWEERYAELKGLPQPAVPYAKKHKALFDAYRDGLKKLLDACDFEIGTHCSVECPKWFVAVKRLNFTAHRGYPIAFDGGEHPTIGELFVISGLPSSVEGLKKFCSEMGIKVDGEPKWHLASMWSC